MNPENWQKAVYWKGEEDQWTLTVCFRMMMSNILPLSMQQNNFKLVFISTVLEKNRLK